MQFITFVYLEKVQGPQIQRSVSWCNNFLMTKLVVLVKSGVVALSSVSSHKIFHCADNVVLQSVTDEIFFPSWEWRLPYLWPRSVFISYSCSASWISVLTTEIAEDQHRDRNYHCYYQLWTVKDKDILQGDQPQLWDIRTPYLWKWLVFMISRNITVFQIHWHLLFDKKNAW